MNYMRITGLAIIMASSTAEAGNLEEATTAFHQGVELYENGKYVEASKSFRKANEINFNWKILYNIGQCEASAKRNGLALQAFEEYITRGGDDIPLDRRNEVMAEIQRLKLLVGMIEITAPEGAIVYVDGESRGIAPLTGPVMVSAGIEHSLTVELGNKKLLDTKIRLSGEQTKDIVLKDKSAEVSTGASPPEKENRAFPEASLAADARTGDTNIRTSGIISLGAGGALLAAGLATGITALSKGNGLEEDYPDGIPLSRRDEKNAVENLALSSDILLGIGAAAVIAGAVLVVVYLKKKKRASAVPVTHNARHDQVGAALHWSF